MDGKLQYVVYLLIPKFKNELKVTNTRYAGTDPQPKTVGKCEHLDRLAFYEL